MTESTPDVSGFIQNAREAEAAMNAIALADQVDAHWRTVSDATARHYTTLLETGMDPKHAARLTRDFQAMVMDPASDEVHVIVEDAD